MEGQSTELRGVLPVVQTPFDATGCVDYGALNHEIEWALGHGVDGLTIAMVSEYLRLTDDERVEVTRATVAATGGRPVIASVGAESAVAACRLALRAEDVGAAAVMAIPPMSVRAEQEEISSYYEALLEAVALPVIVQDASGYVGEPLSIAMQVALLDRFGSRVLFKPEAEPIGPRLSQLRNASQGRARVFEGSGGIALVDSHRRGIVGTMPAVDVCWAIVALWRAMEDGDTATAYAIHSPLTALIVLQTSLDAYVAIEKHLLVRQGVLESARVRGPVGYRLDPETRAEVDRLFDHLHAAVAARQETTS